MIEVRVPRKRGPKPIPRFPCPKCGRPRTPGKCSACASGESRRRARMRIDPSWLPNALKPKTCTWPVCNEKKCGRGLCNTHYRRWWELRKATQVAPVWGGARAWTRQEKDIVVEWWGLRTSAEIGAFIDRSAPAVEAMGGKLGLGAQSGVVRVSILAAAIRLGFSHEGLVALLTRAGVEMRPIRTSESKGRARFATVDIAEAEATVKSSLALETARAAGRRLKRCASSLAIGAEALGHKRSWKGAWRLLPAQWDAVAASGLCQRSRTTRIAEQKAAA